MKAIIPVAGLGTRMLPATKAIPKEMLPVVDKPLIQYVVKEAIDAGISEIVLVTHSSKNAIEDHFDTSYELETQLELRVKRQLLEEVRSICPHHVTITSVRQPIAKGLGHAILCAQSIIGDEDVVVLLPDVIINEVKNSQNENNLGAMIRRFRETRSSQIMIEQVPKHDVSKYGIADLAGNSILEGNSLPMSNIIEKPSTEEAPSTMAVVGRYVLSKFVWPLLRKTKPGAGNEIQLTDAIAMLMKIETIEAYRVSGKSHDCGSKIGYMMANVEYALHHPEVKHQFEEYLLSILESIQESEKNRKALELRQCG